MSDSISKPVALVTGGSRGLGARIVAILRQRGFLVYAESSDTMDVTDKDEVWERICDTMDFGKINVLVNNAAVLGPIGPTHERNTDDWWKAVEVNLLGPVHLMWACLPYMEAGAKVINIAGGGATGPLPRRSAYAASKAGLVRLTECVAEEVREYGIDVNAVLPGPMPTGMVQDMLDAGPEALGIGEYAAHKEVMIAADGDQAITRAAELVAYLASPESDGITGKTISARYDHWPFSPQDKARLKSSDWLTLRRVDK